MERLGSCESVERVPESVDQLREAAREVDVGAADVVERQDAAHEPRSASVVVTPTRTRSKPACQVPPEIARG